MGIRAASFWEVVAMILRGAQIHRDGHGKCGLLPNPTLSSNTRQLSFSGVLANTRMSLCGTFVSVASDAHFKLGEVRTRPTVRIGNDSISLRQLYARQTQHARGCLTCIIHEGSAVSTDTRLRRAVSLFSPSTYYRSMPRLASRLYAFTTNRHE
jgi:hypothetical protein